MKCYHNLLRLGCLIATLQLLLLKTPAAFSFDLYQQINQPSIDLSTLGRVALSGDFAGVSIAKYYSQTTVDSSSASESQLLLQLPNGAYATLGQINGTIASICSISSQQKVFIGGQFSQVNGIDASNIAVWDATTGLFSALSGGTIMGSVNALYCDESDESVYIGGYFQSTNSSNAIVYSLKNGWSELPFGGFNGQVMSIAAGSNSSSVLFGGSFDGTGSGDASSSGTTEQIGYQVINIGAGNVQADGSSSLSGFSDPTRVICADGTDSAGNTWLLADNRTGSWFTSGNFQFRPTKLRLWNTRYEGRGTQTFRFTAQPLEGILNMTYKDPVTGNTEACTSECPLSHDSNIEYQDFTFVNGVDMNGFSIDILQWYGAGGGLNKIELLTDDMVTFAVASYNEPICSNASFTSTSISTGNWNAMGFFPQTNAGYLSLSISPGENNYLTFEPKVPVSGNYSIRLFTPGCGVDDVCTERGIVNVTIRATPDITNSITLYQTNENDKYDTIYTGKLQATSGSFRPQVIITASSEGNRNIQVVAQKIQIFFMSDQPVLNGIFEYDINTYSTSGSYSSTIDYAGRNLSSDAFISSIVYISDKTFASGNFTSSLLGLGNVMQLSPAVDALPYGGLDGAVLSMKSADDTLYLGGTFSGTYNTSGVVGLSNVAAYNLSSNVWQALGAGVDGPVSDIVVYSLNASSASETFVGVSGNFSHIVMADGTKYSANNFAVWVPSYNNWLSQINLVDFSTPYLGGVVTASVVTSNDTSLLAGSLMGSQQLAANNLVSLSNENNEISLDAYPLRIFSQQASISKRDLPVVELGVSKLLNYPSTTDGDVVYYSLYYTDDERNYTVVGGHFNFTGSERNQISNLAFINGTVITGIDPNAGIDAEDSSFYILNVLGSTLFAGGKVSGTIGSSTVGGPVLWDLVNGNFSSIQPPALTGDNVRVNAITVKPNSNFVIVAGDFDQAGSFPCPSVCIYDTETSQWNRPSSGIEGSVSYASFISPNVMVVAGNISLNGNTTYFLSYDFTTNLWSTPGTFPGPVNAMTLDLNSTSAAFAAGQYAINGSTYFGKFDGTQFYSLGSSLGSSSEINRLQVLPTNGSSSTKNGVLGSDRLILVSGKLILQGGTECAAALFDGTNWTPYILATSSSGGPGTIYGLFSEYQPVFNTAKHLSVGAILAIGLGISLFIMMLLISFGLLVAFFRKRRQGYRKAPQMADKAWPGQLPPTFITQPGNNEQRGYL